MKMDKKAVFLALLLCSFNLPAHELPQIAVIDQDSHAAADSTHSTGFKVEFPAIDLIDHRNQPIALNTLFDESKDVVFAFFFSHCVSVCTTITLSLKSIQPDLPPGTSIVMISIDPETDTPELLKSYAQRHQIDDSNWYLLTGERNQIIDLQKSFEAYRGNKMNHNTSLFVKKSNSNVITEIKNNFSVIPGFLNNS
jgi:protein SCO1/2